MTFKVCRQHERTCRTDWPCRQPRVTASGFYGSRNAEDLSATFSPDVGAGFISLSGKFSRGDGFNTTPVDQQNAATVPARYQTWSVGLFSDAPVADQGEVSHTTPLAAASRCWVCMFREL